MTLKQIRIGSLIDVFQYDDGDFIGAIETDQPIKAGAPVDTNDVIRKADLGTYVTGPSGAVADNLVSFNGNTGYIVKDSGLSTANVSDAVSKKHTQGTDTTLGEITSDLVFSGDGSGLPYGSCSNDGVHLAWSQVNPTQNQWYDISDADMADGQLNLVTHDGSGQLAVTKAGRYLIIYRMCLESTVANKHWLTAISVNGTEAAQGQDHYENKAISQEFGMGAPAILDLAAGATINLSVKTTDAGNVTITVDCIEMTVTMVGGT